VQEHDDGRGVAGRLGQAEVAELAVVRAVAQVHAGRDRRRQRVASGAMGEEPTTWILTGSPENFAATRERGFRLIGMKERRRRQAMEMEPGDRIVFYLTKVGRFGAAVRIASGMFEDREPVWPGKPGNPDPYPWRFETEPEIVLEEEDWVPAEDVKDDLEHVRKWPPDHWKLAFQGQLRTVSDADAAVLLARLRAAAGAPA
jgi:hypothetical protein